MPRTRQVYDDWARVLGTARSGAWLASCTIDAFLTEIARLYDADPATLRSRVEEQTSKAPQRLPQKDFALSLQIDVNFQHNSRNGHSVAKRSSIMVNDANEGPSNKASTAKCSKDLCAPPLKISVLCSFCFV